jgi:hypothetical protein
LAAARAAAPCPTTWRGLARSPAARTRRLDGASHAHVVKLLTILAGTAVLEVVVNHNGQTETFQGGIMHSSPGL